MIVKETTSADEIKAILCNGAIYECITGDNCPKADDFEPPIDKCYTYVAGYVNGVIMAIMVYHEYEDGNKCHVQVLPEYRKEYAREFGEQSLEYRGTLPLYAEIPDLYKNVLNFAVSNNFEVIKVKENEYIKNGVFYDVNVLRYK